MNTENRERESTLSKHYKNKKARDKTMTKKELMNALDEMNVKYNKKATKEELEKLYNENKNKESEKEEMTAEPTTRCAEFEVLVDILKRNNIMIINETERRVTTAKVMFCKRKNKVRAYIKEKTYKEMSNEVTRIADRNTQYVAYIDIILNSYTERMICKLCK